MKRVFIFYFDLLKKNRNWLFFVLGLSALWIFFGAVFGVNFPETYSKMIGYVQETLDDVLQQAINGTKFDLAKAIFFQNLKVTSYELFLGAFFGFVPIVSLVFNFFTLGFLSAPSVYPVAFPEASFPLSTFLLLIVPHGIFELPAIFISAAFGLKLGWGWLLPGSTGKRWQVFKSAFADSVRIFPLVFVLLVIAALVESYVTGSLGF